MYNPETLAKLNTQVTEKKKTKQHNIETIQMSISNNTKPGMITGARYGCKVLTSNKTSVM